MLTELQCEALLASTTGMVYANYAQLAETLQPLSSMLGKFPDSLPTHAGPIEVFCVGFELYEGETSVYDVLVGSFGDDIEDEDPEVVALYSGSVRYQHTWSPGKGFGVLFHGGPLHCFVLQYRAID